MKISIVRIGNSKGIILPKSIRELIGLSSDVADMTVEDNTIIISPLKKKYKKIPKSTGRKKIKETILL